VKVVGAYIVSIRDLTFLSLHAPICAYSRQAVLQLAKSLLELLLFQAQECLSRQCQLPPFSTETCNTLSKVHIFPFIGSFQGLQFFDIFPEDFFLVPKVYNALTTVPLIRIWLFYTSQAMAKSIFQNVFMALRTTRLIPPFIESYTETMGMETMPTAQADERSHGKISRICKKIGSFIGRVYTQGTSVIFLGHAGE
jgi:hypothetical protein